MSVKALCKPCMVGQNVLPYSLARGCTSSPVASPRPLFRQRLRAQAAPVAFFVGIAREKNAGPAGTDQGSSALNPGAGALPHAPAPVIRTGNRRGLYTLRSAPQAAPVAFHWPGVDQRPGPKNAGPARTGQPLRLHAASGSAPTRRPGALPLDPGRPRCLPPIHTPLTTVQVRHGPEV